MVFEIFGLKLSISDIANTIMAIASVVNLIIVIWIFFKERKATDGKKEHDRKESWYDSLGLKEITINFSKEIDKLKELSLKFNENNLTPEEYTKCFKETEEIFLKFKNEYITIIECIDNNLDFTENFQQIQDKLINMCASIVGCKNLKTNINKQEINIKFDAIKKEVITMTIEVYK